MEKEVRESIIRLIENSRDAIVSSIDEAGYPNAKAMFRLKNEGLETFWFSTNTSSIRVSHWSANSKASIYFLDSEGFHGLMLTGEMEICSDAEIKLAFWKPGDEKYYPNGPADPDYSILKFTAAKGNYYHGLRRHLFSIEEVREYEECLTVR